MLQGPEVKAQNLEEAAVFFAALKKTGDDIRITNLLIEELLPSQVVLMGYKPLRKIEIMEVN